MRPRFFLPLFLIAFVLSASRLAASDALENLRVKAERGDASARYEFARRVLEADEGSSADRELAFLWVQAGVKQGHARSLELEATLRLISESDHFDFDRGLELLRLAEAANPTSVRAKALRGLLHHQGRGRELNPELGLRLITEAAAAGDALAKALQQQVKSGKGLAEALPYGAPPPALLRAAENGDADAQWQLAQLYFAGHIDHAEKRNPGHGWRERAAENGSAPAQVSLGEAFRAGKDPARALRWFTRAAALKNARAAYLAGLMHRQGEGTPWNDAEAARFFGLAVELGSNDAEAPFGILLVEGLGIAADPARGFALLSRAERRNNLEARRFLLDQGLAGKYQPQDADQFRRLLEQGVRDKKTRAKAILGMRLHRGDGVKQDSGRGSFLLREAMNEGDADAAAEYLDYVNKTIVRLEELKKQGRPVDSEFRTHAEDYFAALILYGRNGTTEQRLEAAKLLSDNWTSPATKKFKDRHGDRIDRPLQFAVALVKLYEREGGKDPAAIRWRAQVEKHYADLKWKNGMGEAASKLFSDALDELRDFVWVRSQVKAGR